MTRFNNKTLAEIVTQDYKTAAVFEKHRLDFCCNGKRTLEQACTDRQIPVDLVLNELQSSMQTSVESCQVTFPFEQLSASQLADYIVNAHHSFVRKESESIALYLHKVTSKHGSRHPETLEIAELFQELKEEMEIHMRKEELVLFPRIKEIEKMVAENKGPGKIDISYLKMPIKIMEEEHDHAGTIMQEIALISDGYTLPTDACTTYKVLYASLQGFELDLHKHVHLENNILFPKALDLFRSAREKLLN